jgi:hypothetical protein
MRTASAEYVSSAQQEPKWQPGSQQPDKPSPARLVLPHPVSGTLEIAAPLPPHMKATFKFFGFEEPRTPKPRKLA